MGDAKRRRQQATIDLPHLTKAANDVGAAIRKLATAASSHLGSDCYLHAAIGQALLQDLGIPSQIVAGQAAWRVGDNGGDVISHVTTAKGHLPPDAQGFAYHAWLESADHIVDFTTYQLRRKAADLDAYDGGRTDVVWCPEVLVLDRQSIRSQTDVAALNHGVAFYKTEPSYALLLQKQFSLDPRDLYVARMILANPHLQVMGTESPEDDDIEHPKP